MESTTAIRQAWETLRHAPQDTEAERRASDAYRRAIGPYVERIRQAATASFSVKGAVNVFIHPNDAIDETLLLGNDGAWSVRAWWRDEANGLSVHVEGYELGASPGDATDVVLTRMGMWRTDARVASARRRLNDLELERSKILAQLTDGEVELVRVGEMVTP